MIKTYYPNIFLNICPNYAYMIIKNVNMPESNPNALIPMLEVLMRKRVKLKI